MEIQLYLQSGKFFSAFGNDIKATSKYMIEVPPKNWRPKKENKYRMPDYRNGIYDGVFDYKVYVKSQLNPNLSWGAVSRDTVHFLIGISIRKSL